MDAGVVSKTGVKEESVAAGSICSGGVSLECSICAFRFTLINSKIQAKLIWEISSLLCSRNCALRTAVDVVYTILHIAPYGHRKRVNSNQIINLKH